MPARIQITERLIKEHGFMAIAIEGDWPTAYGVHRYLQRAGRFENSEHSHDGFQNFPTWMWRNTTIPPFLSRLRKYNDTLTIQHKIGFYGLDLYSQYMVRSGSVMHVARRSRDCYVVHCPI